MKDVEAEQGADADRSLQAEAQRAMVRRLRPLAERDTRHMRIGDQPLFISAFVARDRETISQMAMPSAGLVIVLEGRKELLCGDEKRIYQVGDAFVLAAGVHVDVVNEPDSASGVYRALFIRFSRELIIEGARLWPHLIGKNGAAVQSVRFGPALCSAISHTGEALSGALAASRRLLDHRILEILLILAEQGALPLSPKYVETSVIDAVRLLVRHRLDRPWSTKTIATQLSISEATLRRRMRQEGQTLQALLLAERMQAAYRILSDRDADVADAIAATGYTSRSHFARNFQQAFGASPSAVRNRRKMPIDA